MILLVQFRDDRAGWHELKCVYDAVNISYSRYKVVNALSPFVTRESLEKDFGDAERIILGGAGGYGWEVYKTGNKKLIKEFEIIVNKVSHSLKRVIEKDEKPVLGMCFGHQLIAKVLGCEVKIDSKQSEVGIYKVFLNKDGKNTYLFQKMGNSFPAVLGHKASITKIINDGNFKILASSKRCKVQAFLYKNNTFGVQFHPELDYDDLIFRLSLYPSYKKSSGLKLRRTKIETKQVLRNFFFFNPKGGEDG